MMAVVVHGSWPLSLLLRAPRSTRLVVADDLPSRVVGDFADFGPPDADLAPVIGAADLGYGALNGATAAANNRCSSEQDRAVFQTAS